ERAQRPRDLADAFPEQRVGPRPAKKIPRSARDDSSLRGDSSSLHDSSVRDDSSVPTHGSRPFKSLIDLRARTGLPPSDLRALIKVGALDSIAGGWTRPMMLWLVDSISDCVQSPDDRPGDWFDHLPPAVPVLKEYA